MKTFEVYKHPTIGYEAVKVGFSWPAMFVTFIWMLVKKLWGLAGLWFVFYIVLSMIETVADEAGSEPGLQGVVYLVLSVAYFAMALVPGFKGNEWRRNNLRKRGFEMIQKVEAETPEAATASVAKSSNEQQSETA